MTRNEILESYDVDADGRIRSPGKFEGDNRRNTRRSAMLLSDKVAVLDVRLQTVFQEAAALKSEHGENLEYDRALVELCARLARTDDVAAIAAALGMQSK